mmetsp:Transcript_4709/g.4462  ORF Transcript_4709/g.4462 Transcript_4709/m.4462 type:complete len:136 (-) Transcript_4709:72-479(-)
MQVINRHNSMRPSWIVLMKWLNSDYQELTREKKMIGMYIEKYLLNPPGRWAKKVQTVDIGDEEIESVVEQTKGFSGRAISKLAIAWQAAAYGTDGAILDQETFFRTVDQHKASMAKKDEWIEHAHERAEMLTTDR